MRILEVITLGEIGGAQTVLADIVKGVSSRGYQVEFDVLCGPGDYLTSELGTSISGRVLQVPWLTRNLNPVKDLIALLKLKQLCKTRKYDIVHCHSSKASWLGRMAGFLSGMPRICITVHGLSFHPGNSNFIRHIYKNIERLVLPLATDYIFVSSKDMGEMKKLGVKPELCSLIPNGRPIPPKPAFGLRKILSIPETSPVVCMVARLSKVKQPLSLIKIAQLVLQKYSDKTAAPVFVLIGDGPMLNECQNAINNAGLQNSVYLMGEKADASQYFWDSDIAVLTSNYEACPLAVIEAMATGTPVVASDVGGTGDIVIHGETGYLYKPGCEEEAAQRITDIILDKQLREDMGQTALRRYEMNYSVEKMVDQYIDYFGL